MNNVELNEQYIEFVFDNCDTIKVDMWAIENFRFVTSGESWCWEERHHNFYKTINCSYVYIKLNLNNPLHYYSTPRCTFNSNLTIEEHGKNFINRLATSDDITHFYINGVCYSVPYERSKETNLAFRNELQKNSKTIDKLNNTHLIIEIKKND